jgi:hypothetical protein
LGTLPSFSLFDNRIVSESNNMGNKILVQGSTVSAPQLSDLFRQIGDGSINGIHMQAFLDRRNPFSLDSVKIDWEKVYTALEVSFGAFDCDPNYWTVPVLKGVTPNKVIAALRNLGVEVYIYTDDLDTGVPTNDRDPGRDGDYQVKFLKTIEANPELKDKSADVLAKEGVKGITLLERLLLELGYFLATGNHLDLENVTLCSGSRYSDGHVPHVRWDTGHRGLSVYWCGPSRSCLSLRARAVVS